MAGYYTRTKEHKKLHSEACKKGGTGKWKRTPEQNKKMKQSTKGKRLGKENPRWAGREKMICKYCGKEKEMTPMQKSKRQFCSNKCSVMFMNPFRDMKKEKNPNWRGGLSFFPYSVDWTKTLKRSIRERDKYICQLCGASQGNREFSVHHIDYDKKNCNPRNLITLCLKCHLKTNFNRDYWKQYFKQVIKKLL